MKWTSQDIEKYLQAKEYIDTAVLPLIPISFGEDMQQTALMSEFTFLLSSLLERQYTGRILLLPSFTYIKTKNSQTLVNDLQTFTLNIRDQLFKHIFLLTSDSDWKMHEAQLADDLIWIPALPIESLDYPQKIAMMESQVKQILALFTQRWRENEPQ